MKKNSFNSSNSWTIILCLVLAASCAPLAKTAQVKQAVESKNLRIEVSSANPAKMQPRSISGGYHLALRGDSAFAYLPYFGEVYGGAAAYADSEGGIRFSAPAGDYQASGNEKDGYEISFHVRSPRDSYRLFLSISASGYASISITPTQSSHISYHGELVFE